MLVMAVAVVIVAWVQALDEVQVVLVEALERLGPWEVVDIQAVLIILLEAHRGVPMQLREML